MQDETSAIEYFSKINSEYKSNIDEQKLTSELNKEIKMVIQYGLTGKIITSVEYVFSANDEFDDNVVEDLNNILTTDYTADKHLKNDPLIVYNINTDRNLLIVRFEYEYSMKNEKLKTVVKKSLEDISDTNTFVLTHFDGTQVIPDGKIWVIKELHRCKSDADAPDSSILSQGIGYQCDWVTRDNRIMYLDLIINNKCLALDGNTITDDGWKKYPGCAASPVYDDPDIYIKLLLNPSIVLFPGMKICINTPDNVSRRLLIQELDFNEVNGLSEYMDFKNKFRFNPTDFEYVDFMNIEYWSYRD